MGEPSGTAMVIMMIFDGEHIEFQTAWAVADPVIAALAEKHPLSALN